MLWMYMGSGDRDHSMEQLSKRTVMLIRQFVHVYTIDRYETEALIYVQQ